MSDVLVKVALASFNDELEKLAGSVAHRLPAGAVGALVGGLYGNVAGSAGGITAHGLHGDRDVVSKGIHSGMGTGGFTGALLGGIGGLTGRDGFTRAILPGSLAAGFGAGASNIGKSREAKAAAKKKSKKS